MITFTYNNALVQIVPAVRKDKDIWHIYIDGRYFLFVSKEDTAKRLVTRFLDVVSDSHYKSTRQGITRNLLNSNNN